MKKNKKNFILKATLLSAVINNQINAKTEIGCGFTKNEDGTISLFGNLQTTYESTALTAIVFTDGNIKIIEPALSTAEEIDEDDNSTTPNSEKTPASQPRTIAAYSPLDEKQIFHQQVENKMEQTSSSASTDGSIDDEESDTSNNAAITTHNRTLSTASHLSQQNEQLNTSTMHSRRNSNISNLSIINTASGHQRTFNLQSPAQTALQKGRRLSVRGTNAANSQTGKEFSSDEIDKIKETFSIMLGYNESLETIQNEDPISQQTSPRRKNLAQAKVIGRANTSNELYTEKDRIKPTSVHTFIKELNDQATQIEKWLLELEQASNIENCKALIEQLSAYYAILNYQLTYFDPDANHLEIMANLAFYIETMNDKDLIEKVAYIIMPSIEQLSILPKNIAETISLDLLSTKEKKYLDLREVIVSELADNPALEQQALAIMLIDRFTDNHELFENFISSLNIIKNHASAYNNIQQAFSTKIKSKIEQLYYNNAPKALRTVLEEKTEPSKPESKEQIENLSKNLKDALNKHINKITPAPSLFNKKPTPDKTRLTPEVLGKVMYEAANKEENQGRWIEQDWIEYAKKINIKNNTFNLPDLQDMILINRLSIRKAVHSLWKIKANNKTKADQLNKTMANLSIEQFKEIGYAMQQATGLKQESWTEYAYNLYDHKTTDYDDFIKTLLNEENLTKHIKKTNNHPSTPIISCIKRATITNLISKLNKLHADSAKKTC